MAETKGVDLISDALKRQLDKKKFITGDDPEDRTSSLDTRLIASALRILESRVDFIKSQQHSSVVQKNLKGKYKILVPPRKTVVVCSPKIHSSDVLTAKQCDTGSSPKKISGTPAPLDLSKPPVPPVILYPEKSIKLGWQGNEPVGAGMINLGNTCYLNSTLQALFHVPSFCNWLKSETEHNGIGKCDQAFISGDMCLICAMASTLRILHSHSGSFMKPVLIYGRLKSICKHLSHGHQEDAHEFLRFLIEGMERCFLLRFKGKKLDNLTKETTPLHRIFGGYLRNEVACHSCGKVSTTFQLFQDLYLDIRHTNTLLESMQAFFSRERLEGDERSGCYKCEKCMHKGNCTKRVYVQTPPKVLCLQLKRFTAMGKKIMKHISYPLKLDLSPYVYIRTMGQNGNIISPSPKLRRPIPYKLVSVVSHFGSAMTCGHYTAVGSSAKGSFFSFDDSLVRAVSLNSALGASAYILMYEMEPGWQIGMENHGAEKVNNGSFKPIHSLKEPSGLSNSQNSPSKSLVNLQVKAKSLPDIKFPLDSKNVDKFTATTAVPRTIKSEVIKLSSPSSSSLESDLVKPSSSNHMGSVLPLKSSLNGWSNKETEVALTKPILAVSSSIPESTTAPKSNSTNLLPSSPSKQTSVLQKRHSLPTLSEVRTNKGANSLCLDVISDGPRKEQVPKKLKPSEGSHCDNFVRQITPVASKIISSSNSSHKESYKNPKSKDTTKKNPSSPCLEDVKQSTPLPKKQITLPNLLSKKANASGSDALNTPCHTKMKTLKDWLEVKSRSTAVVKEPKGVTTKMILPAPAVVSTVGGWKVTNQNLPSGGISLDKTCKPVVLKRKQENIECESESKKKKYDKLATAELWRTLFKNKILNSNFKKKDARVSSSKKKLKEKTNENCAQVAATNTIENQVVVQKI